MSIFQHVLLHLANDTAEDVSYGQPKEDINVTGNPDSKRMLEAIKDCNPKNQGTEDGKDNKVKCSYGIDA